MPERPNRDQVAVDQTWNLADIQSTPEQWAAEAAGIDTDIQNLLAFAAI